MIQGAGYWKNKKSKNLKHATSHLRAEALRRYRLNHANDPLYEPDVSRTDDKDIQSYQEAGKEISEEVNKWKNQPFTEEKKNQELNSEVLLTTNKTNTETSIGKKLEPDDNLFITTHQNVQNHEIDDCLSTENDGQNDGIEIKQHRESPRHDHNHTPQCDNIVKDEISITSEVQDDDGVTEKNQTKLDEKVANVDNDERKGVTSTPSILLAQTASAPLNNQLAERKSGFRGVEEDSLTSEEHYTFDVTNNTHGIPEQIVNFSCLQL